MKTIIEFLKKDKVERALFTFIEAFLSYITINALNIEDTQIKYLLIGAIASALSVAINSIKGNSNNEFEGDE